MMALLAKFSDAMSSMDVNCVRRGRGDGVEAGTRRRPGAVAPSSRRGHREDGASTRPDTARAAPSLDKRRFRTPCACLAPLLLGDELGHLAVDLLEGLKPRMGFNHSSHPVVAASVELERLGAQRERNDE